MNWRGMDIHLTHYDPMWNKQKDTETRYDKDVALAIIETMGRCGYNLLLLDIKDAVEYRSLPDIRRRYSVPMAELVELTAAARQAGLEIIPKMNFAKSPLHRHSAWLEPDQAAIDTPEFWRRSLAAVDEVVEVIRPKTVHVGMDEDDARSPQEYKDALHTLHSELKRRNLRMAMWSEVGHDWRPQERWKEIPAIESLPRDVIQLPWSYHMAQREWSAKLKQMGFDVIGVCGYGWPDMAGKTDQPLKNATEWKEVAAVTGIDGVILTQWIACKKENQANLLKAVQEVGPLLAGTN